MNNLTGPRHGAQPARHGPIDPDRPDMARRSLLGSLARLPLIGGSVAILGQPTAAAEPLSAALLDSYDAWLFYERKLLQLERGRGRHPCSSWAPGLVDRDGAVEWLAQIDVVPCDNAGAHWHWPDETAVPSTRAAIVLSAAGCDWRTR